MDKEALNPAVMALLRVLGKAPTDTYSVRVEPDAVTWNGREGECIVTRTWSVRLDLRDLDWTTLEAHEG